MGLPDMVTLQAVAPVALTQAMRRLALTSLQVNPQAATARTPALARSRRALALSPAHTTLQAATRTAVDSNHMAAISRADTEASHKEVMEARNTVRTVVRHNSKAVTAKATTVAQVATGNHRADTASSRRVVVTEAATAGKP